MWTLHFFTRQNLQEVGLVSSRKNSSNNPILISIFLVATPRKFGRDRR